MATDGVFRRPSAGPEVLYVDLAQRQQMKDKYIMALLRKGEGEKETTGQAEEETRRITPEKGKKTRK